jgi:hypothetical protein
MVLETRKKLKRAPIDTQQKHSFATGPHPARRHRCRERIPTLPRNLRKKPAFQDFFAYLPQQRDRCTG